MPALALFLAIVACVFLWCLIEIQKDILRCIGKMDRIHDRVAAIEQQTQKLDMLQIGPCDDPECDICNPIEEGEEWKRGRRHDDE